MAFRVLGKGRALADLGSDFWFDSGVEDEVGDRKWQVRPGGKSAR